MKKHEKYYRFKILVHYNTVGTYHLLKKLLGGHMQCHCVNYLKIQQ